jgi:hemoglobin
VRLSVTGPGEPRHEAVRRPDCRRASHGTARATARRLRGPAKIRARCRGRAATPPPLLYDALGGQAGIEGLADVLIAEIHGDKRINQLFKNTDMPDFRRLLIEQLCEATGGPCIYSGRTMEEAHSGFAITHQEFVFFVEDLNRAMKKAALSPENQQRLLALLGPMEPQVINQ